MSFGLDLIPVEHDLHLRGMLSLGPVVIGALIVGMVTVAVAPVEQPSPAAFELEWSAPATCPAERAVEEKIERYLAKSAAVLATPIRTRARVVQTDAGFELTLGIVGVAGERKLSSDRCEYLADATAFIVSLTVDPTLPLEEPTPPAEEPTPPQPAQPKEVAPPQRVETPPADRGPRARLVVRVDGGPDVGAMPGVGGSLAVAVGAQVRRGRFEVVGRYRLPQRERLDAEPSAGARFMVGTAAARGCGILYARRMEFPLCAALELGAIRATGFGVSQARTEHRIWAGLNVGPALAVVFGPAALFFGVEATTLFLRPRFTIAGGGVVHQLGPVQGRAVVGIELRWPPTKPAPRGK